MAFVVYILYSPSLCRFYVDQTEDLNDRLIRHNSGRNKSTKTGVPWTLVHSEQAPNRAEALARERKIKNLGARRYLEKLGRDFGLNRKND